MLRRQRRVFKRNQKYPNFSNIKEELAINQQVKVEIRNAKKRFMDEHICGELEAGNSKPLYNLIRKSRGCANHVGSIDDCDVERVPDRFAEFFSTVYNKQVDNIPFFDVAPYEPITNMPDLVVKEEGVRALLQSLDPRKSEGPDALTGALLKSFAENVPWFVSCITHIFQTSLSQGRVPLEWKKALVCPIFKGGSRTSPNNYRPVSLTCILSKTLEHIVATEMWNHIEDNNIMSNNQHGFRKRYNTTTQLLHVTYKAAEALNNRENHHIVSFDFSKAFDKVPHKLLLHKLKAYKFNSKIIKWVEHWLSDRTSRVLVNGKYSCQFENISGVPQGSVLGPLLFLLYVNDIHRGIEADCRLYADDTLLCRNVKKTDGSDLQKDVMVLEEWSKVWHMPFNNKKCLHIQIGREVPDFVLFLNGEPIPTSSKVRYLGLTIGSNLKWKDHITNITGQANKQLGMIKRCLTYACSKTKITAFNTIVRPILEYATQVWSPWEVGLTKEVDRVHRRGIRWAYNLDRTDSVDNFMTSNDIENLKERRDAQDLLFLRKMEFGMYGTCLEHYIKRNLSYSTRNGVVGDFKCINSFKYHFFNRMEAQVKVLIPSRY
jgi:hypothetical protein